jgi:hypothetical protein
MRKFPDLVATGPPVGRSEEHTLCGRPFVVSKYKEQ